MSTQGWQDFLAAEGVGAGSCCTEVRPLSSASQLSARRRCWQGWSRPPRPRRLGGSHDDCRCRLTVRLARGVFGWRSGTSTWRGLSRLRPGRSVPSLTAQVRRSLASDRSEARRDRRGFWRTVLGYAPLADDNAVDPLGHGSTVWFRLDPDSRSGTRCTSTCPSLVTRRVAVGGRARRRWTQSRTQTPRVPGSSPTAPETASALSLRRMVRPARICSSPVACRARPRRSASVPSAAVRILLGVLCFVAAGRVTARRSRRRVHLIVGRGNASGRARAAARPGSARAARSSPPWTGRSPGGASR